MRDAISRKARTVYTLAEAGIVRPIRPDKAVRAAVALKRWGATPAAGYTVSAIRCPDDPSIIDELGTLSFGEVHQRTNALAHSFRQAGIGAGDGVAIMCRNHRWFIEATVALFKLGAAALYLNTSFAAPQLADVVKREAPVALVYDEEFADLLSGVPEDLTRFVAWHDGEGAADPTLQELTDAGHTDDLVPPDDPGRIVILTSGTTGTPKGANRAQPESLEPVAAFLSKIPYRRRETMMIAAPLFHSWGLANFSIGLSLGSTYVLRRRFDPEDVLRATAESGATGLVVVPVMMQRIMELPEEVRRRHDLSALRIVAASGSALPGELATRFMDEFGDVIYNLYGSTEVAWASIATPKDLRAAPGTAGRPPFGTVVRLLDSDGREVPRGETGRIFVGNEMPFEGYTGGGSKEVIDGLMSTGDVGHFDEGGRLFVDGRDDEMIVSGGENVFPREVEDLLADHGEISESAVLGVDDPEFGQRLKAFVVREPGSSLDEDQVKAYVKQNLARFKVPREVVFVDELPRTATGKVLKRKLEDRPGSE